MTATVTALIELANEHGFGVALLIIGAQVILDRLMPVEHLVAHLFGAKRSTQAGGAHRGVPATRTSWANGLASSLTQDRNNDLRCWE